MPRRPATEPSAIPPPRPPLKLRQQTQQSPPPPRSEPQVPEAERIEYVIQLLSSGFTRAEILPHLARKFEVDRRAAARYLAEALAELRRAAAIQTTTEGVQHAAMLRSLYRDCVRTQDLRTALDALKLLMRVSGTTIAERDNGVLMVIDGRDPADRRQGRRLPPPEVLDVSDLGDFPSGQPRKKR